MPIEESEIAEHAETVKKLTSALNQVLFGQDELIDSVIAENRSAVIRRGVHYLADSVRRARVGASIAASYREQPQTHEDDELAMASAIAMTEAEPW